MTLPTNLLTLIGDLATEWSASAGIPCLYAGLASIDLGGLVIVIGAPTLDYTDSPACDAGPATVTLTAYLVAQSTEALGVSDLYARVIPVVAALPAGWEPGEIRPGSWPETGDGSPAYAISLTY